MAIDLKKLEEKLDKLLSDETEESFREWLESKRQQLPKHPSVISENGNELLFDKEGNLIKELPQQEISDEEIEKAANSRDRIYMEEKAFIEGAKWYREQLKNKQ